MIWGREKAEWVRLVDSTPEFRADQARISVHHVVHRGSLAHNSSPDQKLMFWSGQVRTTYDYYA